MAVVKIEYWEQLSWCTPLKEEKKQKLQIVVKRLLVGFITRLNVHTVPKPFHALHLVFLTLTNHLSIDQ